MLESARALELAIAHGDTKDVAEQLDAEPGLISIRFSENIGLTPLMWACRNRHVTLVELLLDKGSEVDAVNQVEPNGDGGNSALWFAAQGSAPGNVPLARLLLERGAQINARGEHGTTPFYMAVAWVHMELVQFLLARGADPSLADAQGATPLEALRQGLARLQSQEKRDDDMKRFAQRAPRMIAFLEKLSSSRDQGQAGG